MNNTPNSEDKCVEYSQAPVIAMKKAEPDKTYPTGPATLRGTNQVCYTTAMVSLSRCSLSFFKSHLEDHMLLGRVSTDRLQDPSGWIVIVEQKHRPKITSVLSLELH